MVASMTALTPSAVTSAHATSATNSTAIEKAAKQLAVES
mgnify:CR=1 FL=1